MNKKILMFSMLGLFAIVLVSAGLLTYFGQVQQDVTVEASILVNDIEEYLDTTMYSIDNGWEQKETTKAYVVTNDGERDLEVSVLTSSNDEVITSHDTVGLSTTWSSVADAFADASMAGGVVTLTAEKWSGTDWSASEARITIDGNDIMKDMTLNDLESMSWVVTNGMGYAPHVDVILDNGESLNFEYAKVDTINCDIPANYPTGDFNTFDDNGVIDLGAMAWLNSGPAGPCAETTGTGDMNGDGLIFANTYKSLADWKAEYGSEKILRFEIEVDPWVADSESEISNIVINGESKEITTLGDSITLENTNGRDVFYVNSVFNEMIESGTYPITTTVNLA